MNRFKKEAQAIVKIAAVLEGLQWRERQSVFEWLMATIDEPPPKPRGKAGGRPALDTNDPRIEKAKKLYERNDLSIDDMAAKLKVSKSTFYRLLER